MPSSKSPESVRGFVLAASLVIFLSLCALMLLNWVENPFDAFQTSIHAHINDRQSSVFRAADRTQQMRWMVHEGQRATGDTLLLGTSQVLYGVDTCAYPHMQRLALYALSLGETTQFLEGAGPRLRTPMTLLIQQNLGASLQYAPAARDGRTPTWRDLLDRPTTQVSVANLIASLGGASRPPCSAVAYDLAPGPLEFSPEHTKAALERQSSNPADPAPLRHLLSALAPLCPRIHPTVVLFTAPTFFTAEVGPTLLRFLAENARTSRLLIDAFNQRAEGCHVVFLDLATSYTRDHAAGAPQADWFDLIHFKPATGDRFLQTVVEAGRYPEAPEVPASEVHTSGQESSAEPLARR